MKKLVIAASRSSSCSCTGTRTRRSGACGLPDAKPLWIDYAEGSVGFRDAVFGKPGIVAATSGTAVPAAAPERRARRPSTGT